MIDSIFIGTSGLQGFSKGLKVISNNVANLNTPGFKSSTVQFADLYYQTEVGGGYTLGQQSSQYGTGLSTLGSTLNFNDGETRQTSSPLDASIDGAGYYVLHNKEDGSTSYSRAGQFEFNADGVLVTKSNGREVMGYGGDGAVRPLSLAGLRISPAQASTKVAFSGNLSSTAPDFSLSAVKVIDSAGGEHTWTLSFTPISGEAGAWTVQASEAGTPVGSGTLRFGTDGRPVADAGTVVLAWAPAGAEAGNITLDFSSNVTSFSAGTTSTLANTSTDGHTVGSASQVTFDSQGVMKITYSNGQTAEAGQLQLAVFENNQGLEAEGSGQFRNTDPHSMRVGRAASQGLGKITAGQIETSNVDLSAEFSDLIVMQRGYQASSRVVSTSSEMLQELFDMRGKR
jgi:flagellar hook protein FlgE